MPSSTTEAQSPSMVNLKCIITEVYETKVLPLERKVNYMEPRLQESIFEADPIILFLGIYSSGKTSSIKYLIQEDLPCMNIGPQPTTEGFDVYSYAPVNNTLEGNLALASQRYPFDNLKRFPDEFKSRFKIHEIPNKALQGMILIDSPGILSGAKNSLRNYNYLDVIFELAEMAYKVVILFDVNKVDIPDELKQIIEPLAKNNHQKLILAVNKCHELRTEPALNIFLTLAWQLRSAINIPEMPKLHIVSFLLQGIGECDLKPIIERNHAEFMHKFADISKKRTLSVLSTLLLRIKRIVFYLHLCTEISASLSVFNKNSEKSKRNVRNSLGQMTEAVIKNSAATRISHSDVPPLDALVRFVESANLAALPACKPKYLEALHGFESEVLQLIETAKHQTDVKTQLTYAGVGGGANPFSNAEDEFEKLINRASTDAIKEKFYGMSQGASEVNQADFVKFVTSDTNIDSSVLARIWDIVFRNDTEAPTSIDIVNFGLIYCFITLVQNDTNMPELVPAKWRTFFVE